MRRARRTRPWFARRISTPVSPRVSRRRRRPSTRVPASWGRTFLTQRISVARRIARTCSSLARRPRGRRRRAEDAGGAYPRRVSATVSRAWAGRAWRAGSARRGTTTSLGRARRSCRLPRRRRPGPRSGSSKRRHRRSRRTATTGRGSHSRWPARGSPPRCCAWVAPRSAPSPLSSASGSEGNGRRSGTRIESRTFAGGNAPVRADSTTTGCSR
mmetsp:Transcript_520/g.1953  ORF Transcript_520/g.1953 Transcript_520/m.1953 type:complete len:214 (-) Transcript_520:2248-2889(-)